MKGRGVAFCNQCGSEVPDGARFCQNCGAALAATESVSREAVTEPASAMHPAPMQASPYTPLPSYPPGTYAPPPYAVVPGQPYAPQRSGKAIAGMWLGITSIVPGILMTWVGILLGLLGIIFSAIALGDIRRAAAQFPDAPPPDGKTRAQIGIALSIVGVILSTIFLIYLLNNLDRFGIKITSP
jgi:hypothetical protein